MRPKFSWLLTALLLQIEAFVKVVLEHAVVPFPCEYYVSLQFPLPSRGTPRGRGLQTSNHTESEDTFLKVNSLCETLNKTTASKLDSDYSKQVSVLTVKRRFWVAGLTGRVATRKPFIRFQNKLKKKGCLGHETHLMDYCRLEGSYIDWWLKMWNLCFMQDFYMSLSRWRDGLSLFTSFEMAYFDVLGTTSIKLIN